MEEGMRDPPAAPRAKKGFPSLETMIGDICDGALTPGFISPRYPPNV